MTSQAFATVSIRVLGLAATTVGVILVVSDGALRILGAVSTTRTTAPDIHLHDTYLIIPHEGAAWLAPGGVSASVGVLLLLLSRRLGAWFARGTG